jgi:transposase-like protein
MGTTLDTVGGPNNRKGWPNYLAAVKHRLAAAACLPGVWVSERARDYEINTIILFRWRRGLRAGLLTEPGSQSARLLPAMVQHNIVQSTLPSSVAPARHIVFADAVVRVSASTDSTLPQLVLHSLHT